MLTSFTQSQGSTTLQSQQVDYYPSELVFHTTTLDGSNNLVAQTTYGYDVPAPTGTGNLGIPQHSVITSTPGNQTSSSAIVGIGPGSAPPINTTTAYYDTGVPISTTTPNGTTQYSYDPTQTFATQTTLPTPSSGVTLATSASYDQQSGAQISASGMNAGQTIQDTQYDRLLRPASLSLPNSGVITVTYSGNHTIVDQTTRYSADAINHTLVDAYGRKSRVAVYNGQSTNSWYQVDYCYDATGLP